MFSPLCRAANLAWSEKPSSSWASAPRKSSSRMGVADAVVSTFHMVLFSGMDLVLPASRIFHQLRTSGACTAAPTHHKGYPSSQGVPLIKRGAPYRKQWHSSQNPSVTECHHGAVVHVWLQKLYSLNPQYQYHKVYQKLPPLITKCHRRTSEICAQIVLADNQGAAGG